MRIFPGHRIRARQFGDNYMVSRKADPLLFASAFAVQYFGGGFVVNFGLVNDREPEIKGVPISGVSPTGKREPQPVIANTKKFDEEGRLWVALKVKIDLETLRIKEATVVCTDRLASDNEEEALHALAVLTRADELHQIVHFHLRHGVVRPAQGRLRHLFWSV